MNNEIIKVSVVIPLYNREDYIRRTVDSVLAQTYHNFELIIVDDGSTDSSGEIVQHFTDHRIRLIRQNNAGECSARNRGIAEARSNWIAFLDSDDEWMPGFLESTMATAASFPEIVAVFTNIISNGKVFISKYYHPGVLDDYFSFFVDNYGHAITSSSVVVRKEAIITAGCFPDGVRYGGDVDCWTRLAWLGSIAYIPDVLAIWHTEAVGRVLQDGAAKSHHAALVTVDSYNLWKSERRIPERLISSSTRMAQFMYLRYVVMLNDAGYSSCARKVLRNNCNPFLCGHVRYWKSYVRTFIPKIMLTIYYRLRLCAVANN